MRDDLPANPEGVLQEMQIAVICERLHRLPSEVLAEDYATMQRVWAWISEIDRIRAARK